MPSIALCIAAYNQSKQLSLSLRMLARQSQAPDQIIIADDGSKDDIYNTLEKSDLRSRITWVRQDNKGFRKNRILNGAIRACKTDKIIFTDADCIPHKNFIQDHCIFLAKNTIVQGSRSHVDPNWAINVGTSELIHFWGLLSGNLKGWRRAIRWPIAQTFNDTNPDGGMGCNMSFWIADLLHINGFDESYHGWGYGEDSDPCARAVLAGATRVNIVNRGIIFHIDHPLSSRAQAEDNRIRFLQVIANRSIRCKHGLDAFNYEDGSIVVKNFN
jgi:glycosyltransferase involved in cell wall biosynthesis